MCSDLSGTCLTVSNLFIFFWFIVSSRFRFATFVLVRLLPVVQQRILLAHLSCLSWMILLLLLVSSQRKKFKFFLLKKPFCSYLLWSIFSLRHWSTNDPVFLSICTNHGAKSVHSVLGKRSDFVDCGQSGRYSAVCDRTIGEEELVGESYYSFCWFPLLFGFFFVTVECHRIWSIKSFDFVDYDGSWISPWWIDSTPIHVQFIATNRKRLLFVSVLWIQFLPFCRFLTSLV